MAAMPNDIQPIQFNVFIALSIGSKLLLITLMKVMNKLDTSQ